MPKVSKSEKPAAQKPVIVVKSGQQLYDIFMQEIEPDLVSTEIPTLHIKYAKETPAERKERAKRYKAAFAEYDKVAAQFMAEMNAQLSTYKKRALTGAEKKARAEEEQQLQELESSILS